MASLRLPKALAHVNRRVASHFSTSWPSSVPSQAMTPPSYLSLRAFSSGSSGNLARSSWSRSSIVGSSILAGSLLGATAYWYRQSDDKADLIQLKVDSERIDSHGFGVVVDTLLWPFTAVKQKISRIFNEVFQDFADPSSDILLPPAASDAFGNVPRTIVLDVEGTLMYNSWERGIGWRAIKRPGVDLFLTRLFRAGYEIVAFSSGHQATLEPCLNRLDVHRVIAHRLYRDATTYRDGVHCKDLSKLNRPLNKVIIVDDEPESFSQFSDNGIHIKKFTGDPNDTELFKLIPLLESMVSDDVNDVREVLRQYKGDDAGQQFMQHRQARTKQMKLQGGQSDSGSSSPRKSWASRLGFGSK